ncbi:ABC transporter ATP-binding protein [Pollutimonas harenae]|uniref:ABC transporter ATP-binding protein n=1 Tax=Pollutimonas harenae TaxID=657015 RepID=A0A853GVN3_9BURK|nr:ABC transporter ATP-binding protein [Pollutimonas harenae]NYT86381.1 ABC transporter ATP-binding protein [Pollutimonas harenae]TEA69863.1 ABC transporter ATP-binding protein [Pollutimonas harenae]
MSLDKPSAMPVLSVSGLHAWYGAAHILHDVSLEVGRGEVVGLMGRNGAGKSTTLKAIMGLLARRQGDVRFMGQHLMKRQPYEIARLGLGYVPEERRIFTELTVKENLIAGQQAHRTWPDGTPGLNWTFESVFDLFPPLADMQERPAGDMSGGEQQMLAVARTLMGNPYCLLLDEPSEGVAPLIVEQMAEMILALKMRGASVLLSEQNIHFAQLVSDRAYVLEKGVIRYSGTMHELAGNEVVRREHLAL